MCKKPHLIMNENKRERPPKGAHFTIYETDIWQVFMIIREYGHDGRPHLGAHSIDFNLSVNFYFCFKIIIEDWLIGPVFVQCYLE